MPLLLDTQIIIWLESDDPRLSAKISDYIFREPLLLVSMASIWEIAIKFKTGKLKLDQPLNQFVESFLTTNNCKILDISLPHIYKTQLLPLHHRNPFDRLLIAQAFVEQLAIVSSDQLFDQYGVSRLF